MKKEILAVFALTLAVAAQATVYRAGLKGGFINSYDGNSYTTVAIADTGVFASVEAGGVKASSNGSKTYPPVWVDNRTWRYHGQMYFDGGTYYFAESIDDAVYMAVDGTQILKNETWNDVGVSSAVAPAAGWHDVEIRLGNGTGGAGCPYDDSRCQDANGRLCGFGVVSYETAPDTNPSAMSTFTFVENTSGNVWMRCVEDVSYITVNSIEKTANGYSFSITSSSPSPATVVVYVGESAGSADSATGWTVNSGDISFAANETKSVEVVGTFVTPPYFVVSLSGTGTTLAEGDGVYFWEWSDVKQCTMQPTVSASLSAVTGTNGTFAVTLGYDKTVVGMDPPAIALKAYYGAADAGTTAAEWDEEVDFGSANVAGTAARELSNLTEGLNYYVRFAAKTAESDWVWSECLAFATVGPSLAAWPSLVYESDLKSFSFAVTRSAAASAEPLTVYLSYSANAATLATGLPASVDFAAGVSEVVVPFSLVDNDTADGDAALVVSIVPNAAYPVGNPVSATITVVDDESLTPTTCVWTGLGGGSSWALADNWDPRVPTIVDTAKFTSSGLSANQSVTISGDAVIKELLIETATAFTLASDGGTLELGAITRSDVDGTEGNHTIEVPLIVYAGSETNCIWNVAGSNALRINADISKAGSVWVMKRGAGTVEMRKAEQTYPGPWIVESGIIALKARHSISGSIYVGGSGEARVNVDVENGTGYGTYPHVYADGFFGGSQKTESGRVKTVYVFKGGRVQIGSWSYIENLEYHGGSVTGGSSYNSLNITCHASDEMAVMGTEWKLNGGRTISVERGTAPVDLKLTAALTDGGSSNTEKKTGDGVVKSTRSFSGMTAKFKVEGGTWYVDSTGEYGLGVQETTVSAGAKLGGTGCVGMKDVKSYATLALSNGSESSYATLSPGTIDETTGAHIYGTFTSGRSSAHNKLTLGNWAHLEIGVGPKNSETKLSDVDKLMVYGDLEIGSNCTLDLTANTAALDKIAGGTYTIVEADKITGEFATVVKPKPSWRIAYEKSGDPEVVTKIILTVTKKGFAVLVR